MVETGDPGGNDEVESIGPGGHNGDELIGSGRQMEAEASPFADRIPRFVAELADCSTVTRENGEV